MIARRVTLAAAGLASLALAAPAAAQTTEPLPVTGYWFACTGPQKVETANPVWGTTKPAASFTAGAGCGFLDPGPQPGAVVNGRSLDFVGGGKHTGPIQAITVELHSLATGRVRVPPDVPFIAELSIDGQVVATSADNPRITPVTSSTGASESYTFSFARRKPSGQPVAPPLAAGAGEHTVSVRFTSRTVEYQHTWVWGATEVPAGVTVNPAKLSGPIVLA